MRKGLEDPLPLQREAEEEFIGSMLKAAGQDAWRQP